MGTGHRIDRQRLVDPRVVDRCPHWRSSSLPFSRSRSSRHARSGAPRGRRCGVGALPAQRGYCRLLRAKSNTTDGVASVNLRPEKSPPGGTTASPCAAAGSGRGAGGTRSSPWSGPTATPLARTPPCCSWRRASLFEVASPVADEEVDACRRASARASRAGRDLAGERLPAPPREASSGIAAEQHVGGLGGGAGRLGAVHQRRHLVGERPLGEPALGRGRVLGERARRSRPPGAARRT